MAELGDKFRTVAHKTPVQNNCKIKISTDKIKVTEIYGINIETVKLIQSNKIIVM
jgi:hypothetical protein